MRYLEKTEFYNFSNEVQEQVKRIFAYGADECFITTCGGAVIVTETRPALIQPVNTCAIHAKTLYTPEQRDELFKKTLGFPHIPSFVSRAKAEKAAGNTVDEYAKKHDAVLLLKQFILTAAPQVQDVTYYVKTSTEAARCKCAVVVIGEYVRIEYKGGGVREIDVTATSLAYIGVEILREVA